MKVDGIPGNAEIITSAIAPSRNDGTEKNVSYLGDWATNGATPNASKGEDCHKKRDIPVCQTLLHNGGKSVSSTVPPSFRT